MDRQDKQLIDLTEEFSKELVMKTSDTLLDYGELSIDNLFDNEIVKEIPVIKTIASVCKIGLTIKERFFAKKLLIFLNEYKKKGTPNYYTEKFICNMNDQRFKNRVMEFLIIYLYKISEHNKAKMLSNLFIGYIKEKYDWNTFKHLADCLDLIFISDISTLRIFFDENGSTYVKTSTELESKIPSIIRLKYLGFISAESNTAGFSFSTAEVIENYSITQEGIMFLNNIQS